MIFFLQVHYISNQRIAETGDTSGVMIEYQVRESAPEMFRCLSQFSMDVFFRKDHQPH